MTHPLPEGDYHINAFSVSTVVQHVAALPISSFVMVTRDNVPTPNRLWRLKFSGDGYTFQNLTNTHHVHTLSLTEGAPLYLTAEASTVFNIQPDGKGLWHIVVPDHDLIWTEQIYPADMTKGFMTLSGSVGSDKQKFTFQRLLDE